MELINKHFVGDFLGFTYDGTHSSTLGLVRVSAGNRYTKNLFPAFANKTVQPDGKDGFYYFGAYYTNNQMQIDTAFDNLSEEQFQKLSRVFNCKKFKELWFDETPYKAYWAKLAESPQIKYLCFTGDNGQRIYKGDMSLKFETLEPYAHNRVVTWEDNVQVIRQTGNNVENDALVIEGLMEDLTWDKDETRYVPILFRRKGVVQFTYYVDIRMLEDFYFYIEPIIEKELGYQIQIELNTSPPTYKLFENKITDEYLSDITQRTFSQANNNNNKRPLYYNYLRYNLTENTNTNEAYGKLCESFNFKDWKDSIPVKIENNNYGVKNGDYLLKFVINKDGNGKDVYYKFVINNSDNFILKIKNKIFPENVTSMNLYIDSKRRIIYILDSNGAKNILNIEKVYGDIFTLPLGEYQIKVYKQLATGISWDDSQWGNNIDNFTFSNNIESTGNIIKPYYYFY